MLVVFLRPFPLSFSPSKTKITHFLSLLPSSFSRKRVRAGRLTRRRIKRVQFSSFRLTGLLLRVHYSSAPPPPSAPIPCVPPHPRNWRFYAEDAVKEHSWFIFSFLLFTVNIDDDILEKSLLTYYLVRSSHDTSSAK